MPTDWQSNNRKKLAVREYAAFLGKRNRCGARTSKVDRCLNQGFVSASSLNAAHFDYIDNSQSRGAELFPVWIEGKYARIHDFPDVSIFGFG
jgi:hypothetical protein